MVKPILQANSHGVICGKQLVGPTYSDKLIPLTQLTIVGAIFAFKRCDISCML